MIRVLFYLLVFLFVSGGYAASEDIFEDEWLYSKTDDFELISNASKRNTSEIIEDLYEFKNAFEAVFAGIKKYPDPYFAFVICKDKETLNVLYKRKKKNLAGVFGGNDEAGFAAINAKEWGSRSAKKYLYHEYVHRLFSKSGEELPLWFNEGIAETFETFQVNRKNAVFGHPNYNAQDFLMSFADSFMPFERLFAVHHDSPAYQEHGAVHYFYATSWAFTHFCMFGREGKYKEALLRFVEANKAGDRSEETFKKLFGMSFDQTRAEMKKYLGGGVNVMKQERYNVIKIPREELPEKYQFSLVKSKEADVRRIVGGILAFAGDGKGDIDKRRQQRAREILVSARIENPEDLKLTAMMGMLEHVSENLDRAEELYEEAIAGDVGVPFVYINLAELKLKKRREDSQENLTINETIPFLELLFKGRSLGSTGSRLYRTIAEVYLFSDFEAKKGHLAILDEGLKLYARDYELALKTAQLKYRAGLTEEADFLVSRYLNANIPEGIKESFKIFSDS